MTVQEVTISPKRAEEWLLKNMPQNRRQKLRLVNKIVADILAGRWLMDGSTIKFNTAGFLIDGQHRLTAIMKAGKTVKSLVCYDVDSAAINTIDTGAARSTADVLAVNGISASPRSVAALARKILTYNKGKLTGLASPKGREGDITNQEILSYCQENDLGHFINYGMHLYKQAVTRELLNSAEWQFVYWMTFQADKDDAARFCLDLAKLKGGDGSVIRTLFESLTRTVVANDPATKLKLISHAWNAWRQDIALDVKLRKVQEAEIPELV